MKFILTVAHNQLPSTLTVITGRRQVHAAAAGSPVWGISHDLANSMKSVACQLSWVIPAEKLGRDKPF